MTDPTQYPESAGGAPTSERVLTAAPGAGRRPDPAPSVRTLASALVAALGELSDVVKRHKAGNRFTYADLPDVHAITRPTLVRYGLGQMQDVTTVNGEVRIETTILHVSGDVMRFGPLGVPVDMSDLQAVGSATTYLRRYALCAALGIAADDDDDGQRAVPPPASRPPSGQGRAAPGGSSPSPSGGDPTGIPPWHVDPPDPLHAEQVDDWLVRLGRLPDGELKNELRLAANRAGWVARYALTGTVANAVLDVWEARLDDVEALEQALQHPALPVPDPPGPPGPPPVPYPRWKAEELRAELGRRGHAPPPETRKVDMIAALYRLDSGVE